MKRALIVPLLLLIALPLSAPPSRAQEDCPIFPADHIWNTRIDDLPVHPLSDDYIATIGAETPLHPDFGSGFWPPESQDRIGIPFNWVAGDQPLVEVVYTEYGEESDPGPMPIPPDALREAGSDHHVLVVDYENCKLYELYHAEAQADGTWEAGSGAVYDLKGYALRPLYWTSADAAGLPIVPGLVRYPEVEGGEITHALRVTLEETQRAFVWPARHFASAIEEENYPPLGLRMRLRADFDTGGFSPAVRVLLVAMQRYGLIVADNGSSMFISGAPDERWDNELLVSELRAVTAGDFEVVDSCLLMDDPDSGRVAAEAHEEAPDGCFVSD